MAKNVSRSNRPRSDRLHPLIYKVIVGLALWTILAAWGFFGDRGYTGLALAVVTGFFMIAMALPSLLWRTWRNNRASVSPAQGGAPDAVRSFRDWLFGDVETWQGRLEGWDAAVAVLLPIAAVAIGMTAFAIVLHFTATRGG
ncbi:MAG: hypothetical protein ACOY3L_00180 [Pseudomonadota bacterium]